MDKVSDITELRKNVRAAKLAGKKVSFVPTMGALHAGHLSLVRIAASQGEYIVASLFVNPTQFNDPRDYELYPRDFAADCKLLQAVGVSLVFMPEESSIYGKHFKSAVTVSGLSEKFEGKSRPGHFQGVATVVAILLNMVQPDFAVFGEKDFQQLCIIEQMVSDLKILVEIVRAPLVRDADGLALSSRNVRLSKDARAQALSISKGLFLAVEAFKKGEASSAILGKIVRDNIEQAGAVADYVEVINEQTLEPMVTASSSDRILVAALVDGIRLIDNIALRS